MPGQSILRPGGALAVRALHFIWLADCSGSMSNDAKIQSLNHAIREAIPHMRRVADDNPNATILVRALCFSDKAHWHVERPTPVEEFRWDDVPAGGVTDMGYALRLVADEMARLTTGKALLPPVLALLTDGRPTDDFEGGLKALLRQPLGKAAVRIAIAIGKDADHEPLEAFIADPSRRPLQANNAESLVNYIKWVSTVVVQHVSSPLSQPTGTFGGPGPSLGLGPTQGMPPAGGAGPAAGTGPVPIPKPPPPSTDGDVW